jgi:imidazole glycerol phosphate synthase glutamine amidotransferase subunit
MANIQVGLIDHGIGNIRSVHNALVKVGMNVTLVQDWAQAEGQQVLILPGVGNFGGVVDALDEKGLFEPLREYLNANKPFIGICVGMQLLFEGSTEAPGRGGFGLLQGELNHLSKLDSTKIIPSIGWKNLHRPGADQNFSSLSLAYFVHSYYVSDCEPADLVAVYDWQGYEIPAHVSKGNIHGVQFHPEKSRSDGVEFLGKLVEKLAE